MKNAGTALMLKTTNSTEGGPASCKCSPPHYNSRFQILPIRFSQSGRWTGDVGKKVAIYILAAAPARKYGSSEEEGEGATA